MQPPGRLSSPSFSPDAQHHHHFPPPPDIVNLFVGGWRRFSHAVATVNSVIQSSTVLAFPHARFNQIDEG